MDERSTRYMGELEQELRKLPARDREDALREIRSHLQEASDSGTPSPLTLARLGSPRNLAAAYMGDYLSARESSLPTRALRVAAVGAYVFGTTFSSLFVVPILAISAITFGIAGVVTPILGLMRTFGATWIQMDVPGHSIPTSLSFPVGLVIGVVCIGIAALSVAVLRLYLQLLVRSFRIVAAQVLAGAMSIGDKSVLVVRPGGSSS
jgi:uncharacterized membrane protein